MTPIINRGRRHVDRWPRLDVGDPDAATSSPDHVRAPVMTGMPTTVLSVDDSAPQCTFRTPVVVFLRGAGAGKSTWSALTAAAASRGWITTRDRTQAWHLARGGLATVMIDFSDIDLDQPGPVTVTAGRVLAKYDVTAVPTTVGRLLTPADRQRFSGAGWLNAPVTTENKHTVLPLQGERVTVPLRLDHHDQEIDFARLAQVVSELAG